MAWISKVSEHDYVARFVGGGKLLIENRRTSEKVHLPDSTMKDIVAIHGHVLTSPQVVNYCIEKAIISHPVEEYV